MATTVSPAQVLRAGMRELGMRSFAPGLVGPRAEARVAANAGGLLLWKPLASCAAREPECLSTTAPCSSQAGGVGRRWLGEGVTDRP